MQKSVILLIFLCETISLIQSAPSSGKLKRYLPGDFIPFLFLYILYTPNDVNIYNFYLQAAILRMVTVFQSVVN